MYIHPTRTLAWFTSEMSMPAPQLDMSPKLLSHVKACNVDE